MSRIKGVSKVDMPREKLEKYGPEKLTDSELLALLLGSGIKGLNVLQLAKKILKLIEKMGVEKVTLEMLFEEKGLGKAKASQIIAILALGKRLQSKEKPEILTPQDVWKLCADFRESKREHFAAFYLDTQGKVIDRQIISIGTLDASLVHPREVFEPAVSLRAASIIVAHNHPSGNLEPSREDIEITKQLVEAGKILNIQIIDHVIITKIGFTSTKKKGIIS
ncbi:MAG: JAB domain-containing protein [Candidatus Moraniibacteriota bacterium]|nr:MAG: JAB domain-containing protein [Candidatus Moranbacteria bacterium]